VPWLAWFGSQILINGPSWSDLSHAFWSMLVMPIGGPIAFFLIAWIVAGFQKSEIKPEVQRTTPKSIDQATSSPRRTAVAERLLSNNQPRRQDPADQQSRNATRGVPPSQRGPP
jgi:hypothetical protein